MGKTSPKSTVFKIRKLPQFEVSDNMTYDTGNFVKDDHINEIWIFFKETLKERISKKHQA